MATIFPLSASVGQVYNGYEFDGVAWNIIGVDLTQDYALESELTAHSVDTTNVHGIPDTSLLSTQAYVQTAASAAVSAIVNAVPGYEKSIPLQSSEPASPAASDLWVDSTIAASPVLKVYDGTSWISVGAVSFTPTPILFMGA